MKCSNAATKSGGETGNDGSRESLGMAVLDINDQSMESSASEPSVVLSFTVLDIKHRQETGNKKQEMRTHRAFTALLPRR